MGVEDTLAERRPVKLLAVYASGGWAWFPCRPGRHLLLRSLLLRDKPLTKADMRLRDRVALVTGPVGESDAPSLRHWQGRAPMSPSTTVRMPPPLVVLPKRSGTRGVGPA